MQVIKIIIQAQNQVRASFSLDIDGSKNQHMEFAIVMDRSMNKSVNLKIEWIIQHHNIICHGF